MTKKRNVLIVVAAVFFMAYGFHAVTIAQAGAGGSYTDAQAMAGEELYAEQCAACHGADLSGVADLFPALTGDAFVATWQERPLGELYESVSITMPALNPGSLTPAQAASLVAYILSASGYPSGSADLATDVDALNAITIGAP